MNHKQGIRNLIRKFGFDLVRYGEGHEAQEAGSDPFSDMRHFLAGIRNPMIFDVGANVGQSIDRFKRAFPDPVIHSFEPSPTTFSTLSSNFGKASNVNLWNLGVGSKEGNLTFYENKSPVMSSFLKPDVDCWGEVVRTTEIKVVTLDAFARENGIDSIDVLKSDTQGFDLEVFKGASGLLGSGRVKLIYFEFIFSKMYCGLPGFHEVFQYLSSNNFKLVSFYERFHQGHLLSWSDFLFVHEECHRKSE